MLAKLNDNALQPVEFSAGVARERQAKDGRSQDCFDTLYPVDQWSADNDAEDEGLLMLWGDVSISARHPMSINV